MEILTGLASTFGLGGVFLYLYFTEKKRSEAKHDEKDSYIKDMHAKLLSAFENNTKSQTEMRHAIRENTEATRTLSTRVEDVLRRK